MSFFVCTSLRVSFSVCINGGIWVCSISVSRSALSFASFYVACFWTLNCLERGFLWFYSVVKNIPEYSLFFSTISSDLPIFKIIINFRFIINVMESFFGR
jgi:hypothetical protein